MFGAVESLIDAGHDPRRFAIDLLERFRDLIVLQAVPDAAARGVVDAPDDVLERMRSQAERLGTATLTRYAEVVHAGLGEMRGATAPRLLLEVVCARLLLPSASDTEAALLQRIERIETRLDMSIPAAEAAGASALAAKNFTRRSQAPEQAQAPEPAQAPSRPKHPSRLKHRTPPHGRDAARRGPARPGARARRRRHRRNPHPSRRHRPEPAAQPAAVQPPPQPVQAPPPAATGEPDAAAVRTMWPTVREKVRERRRPTDVMLDGAIVVAVEGDTLVLSHVSGPLAKRLNEARNVEIIRDALKDALGVNWNIRCEAGRPDRAAAGGTHRSTGRRRTATARRGRRGEHARRGRARARPCRAATRRRPPSNYCRPSWAPAGSTEPRASTTAATAARRRRPCCPA